MGKRILIVVDMQNDFINGSLGTTEAAAIVPNVVNKIASYQHDTVFATLDTHPDNYLETSEGKKLPVPHCIKGTAGHEIAPAVLEELNRCNSCTYLEKPTFGSIDLMHHIQAIMNTEEVSSIELCGLCTDICVVSNTLLLKALCPETQIVVDASCCAGVTPATHQAALTTMSMCQIDIVNNFKKEG